MGWSFSKSQLDAAAPDDFDTDAILDLPRAAGYVPPLGPEQG
jgi:hypothetical protein